MRRYAKCACGRNTRGSHCRTCRQRRTCHICQGPVVPGSRSCWQCHVTFSRIAEAHAGIGPSRPIARAPGRIEELTRRASLGLPLFEEEGEHEAAS